jgi:hypothetical protein
VRVAFVVANQQGNNLYLDNIEFFTTADPDAIEIDEAYSIYGYDLSDQGARDLRITFNLPEKENVQYTVINTAGQIKRDVLLNDVLNQTFPLEVNTLASGMYFVRLRIGDRYFTTKILIN